MENWLREVRGSRPSQTARRTGHPLVLVMPARSKAWATRQARQKRIGRVGFRQTVHVVVDEAVGSAVGSKDVLRLREPPRRVEGVRYGVRGAAVVVKGK